MVGSLVVKLRASDGLRLRGLGGEAIHSLLFNMLRKVAPDFAARLHSLEETKPFCLWTAVEEHSLTDGYLVVAPGRSLSVRISALTEEVLKNFLLVFYAALTAMQPLRLGRKEVAIESVDVRCEGFAAVTSFRELLEKACSHSKIVLEFTSPTSFKSGGVQLLFPEPKLVFSSLLRKWDAFSDVKYPDDCNELFSVIRTSHYDLRTEIVNFSRYRIIGFKGTIEYEVPEDTPQDLRHMVNALADFAFYAGVGVKTTMGMGQVKRVNPAENRRNMEVIHGRACTGTA